MKKLLIMIGCLAAAGQGYAALVIGDVVSIDFGATTAASGNYNKISSSDAILSIADVVRFSDGASTGVGFALGGASFDNNVNYIAPTIFPANINATDSTIFADGMLNADSGSGNSVVTMTFSGLDDSLTYDLTGGFSRSGSTTNWRTEWSIAGSDSQTSLGTPNGGYLSFEGLSTNGSGDLVITLTDLNKNTAISQLSLTVASIPEPGTTAFFIAGLAGLLAVYKRFKR